MHRDIEFSSEIPTIIKWKSPQIEPVRDMPILWVSVNGKIGTFKDRGSDWEYRVKKYKVFAWVYQDKIIPAVLQTEE